MARFYRLFGNSQIETWFEVASATLGATTVEARGLELVATFITLHEYA